MLKPDVLPDAKIIAIGLDDYYFLGVLTSSVHLSWALRTGAFLGVGNDSNYNHSACFGTFAFPDATDAQKARIRELGEALDSHRKRQQALYPTLTLTGLYNTLEKLRAGETFTAKDREIHEHGLVSVLRQLHDDLDAAGFDAYGWPADLGDDALLERLVALNHERAAEERAGLVRWLRPAFQNPAGARPETQATLAEAGLETVAPAAAPAGKRPPWPKALPDRLAAARALLASAGTATAADLTARYKGARHDDAEKLLESLAAVGLALETPGAHPRRWEAVR